MKKYPHTLTPIEKAPDLAVTSLFWVGPIKIQAGL